VECVLRNEPVRHRNQQSAPIDPEHDYIETIFYDGRFGSRAGAGIAIRWARSTSLPRNLARTTLRHFFGKFKISKNPTAMLYNCVPTYNTYYIRILCANGFMAFGFGFIGNTAAFYVNFAWFFYKIRYESVCVCVLYI